MSARAAVGTFPYPHRTVAEIWAAEAQFRAGHKGPCAHDRRVGGEKDMGRNGLQQRSTLPNTSCPRCGARGHCGHNGRIAA